MKRIKIESGGGLFYNVLESGNMYEDDNDMDNAEDDSDDSVEQIKSDETGYLTNSSYFNYATSQKAKGELVCVVCGASANGYNFDAITCESCKAFFRRNAFKPLNQFRCINPNSNGTPCTIDVVTRKKCKKCRVVKCFSMGMRKDWIMTDHEREEKKRKIEENRRRKDCSMTFGGGYGDESSSSPSSSTTGARPIRRRRRKGKSFIDSSTIKQIKPSRVSKNVANEPIKLPIVDSLPYMISLEQIVGIVDAYNRSVRLVQGHGVPVYFDNLVKILNVYEIHVRRLIYFVKLVPDLVYMDMSILDKLLRANMSSLLLVHCVGSYDKQSRSFREPNTTDTPIEADYIEYLFGSPTFTLIVKLNEKLTHDAVVILLLVVLFNHFDVNLSYMERDCVEKMRCKYMDLFTRCSRDWSSQEFTEIYQMSHTATESIRRSIYTSSSSSLRPLMAHSLDIST